MKISILSILIALFVITMSIGCSVADATGDENYNWNGEDTTGAGWDESNIPEDGMARETPQTRNKDR